MVDDMVRTLEWRRGNPVIGVVFFVLSFVRFSFAGRRNSDSGLGSILTLRVGRMYSIFWSVPWVFSCLTSNAQLNITEAQVLLCLPLTLVVSGPYLGLSVEMNYLPSIMEWKIDRQPDFLDGTGKCLSSHLDLV